MACGLPVIVQLLDKTPQAPAALCGSPSSVCSTVQWEWTGIFQEPGEGEPSLETVVSAQSCQGKLLLFKENVRCKKSLFFFCDLVK